MTEDDDIFRGVLSLGLLGFLAFCFYLLNASWHAYALLILANIILGMLT